MQVVLCSQGTAEFIDTLLPLTYRQGLNMIGGNVTVCYCNRFQEEEGREYLDFYNHTLFTIIKNKTKKRTKSTYFYQTLNNEKLDRCLTQ